MGGGGGEGWGVRGLEMTGFLAFNLGVDVFLTHS